MPTGRARPRRSSRRSPRTTPRQTPKVRALTRRASHAPPLGSGGGGGGGGALSEVEGLGDFGCAAVGCASGPTAERVRAVSIGPCTRKDAMDSTAAGAKSIITAQPGDVFVHGSGRRGKMVSRMARRRPREDRNNPQQARSRSSHTPSQRESRPATVDCAPQMVSSWRRIFRRSRGAMAKWTTIVSENRPDRRPRRLIDGRDVILNGNE